MIGACQLKEACHPNGHSPLKYLECCDAWACEACQEHHQHEIKDDDPADDYHPGPDTLEEWRGER